jgi:ubiquitin C-terminal hydrolase
MRTQRITTVISSPYQLQYRSLSRLSSGCRPQYPLLPILHAGNTCFMNACLQGLLHCPPLVALFAQVAAANANANANAHQTQSQSFQQSQQSQQSQQLSSDAADSHHGSMRQRIVALATDNQSEARAALVAQVSYSETFSQPVRRQSEVASQV